MSKSNNHFAILPITSLFSLWEFVLNPNPIIIPDLNKAGQLTDAHSAFINLAQNIDYFLMAIPAGTGNSININLVNIKCS